MGVSPIFLNIPQSWGIQGVDLDSFNILAHPPNDEIAASPSSTRNDIVLDHPVKPDDDITFSTFLSLEERGLR
jgi:hypothetical protein